MYAEQPTMNFERKKKIEAKEIKAIVDWRVMMMLVTSWSFIFNEIPLAMDKVWQFKHGTQANSGKREEKSDSGNGKRKKVKRWRAND